MFLIVFLINSILLQNPKRNQFYLYNIGSNGFLTYSSGNPKKPILINNYLHSGNSSLNKFIFTYNYNPEKHKAMIYLTNSDQGTVFDVKNKSSLISFSPHGFQNQQFIFRMVGILKFQIVNNNRCLEAQRLGPSLYRLKMNMCVSEGSKNYDNQLFKMIDLARERPSMNIENNFDKENQKDDVMQSFENKASNDDKICSVHGCEEKKMGDSSINDNSRGNVNFSTMNLLSRNSNRGKKNNLNFDPLIIGFKNQEQKDDKEVEIATTDDEPVEKKQKDDMKGDNIEENKKNNSKKNTKDNIKGNTEDNLKDDKKENVKDKEKYNEKGYLFDSSSESETKPKIFSRRPDVSRKGREQRTKQITQNTPRNDNYEDSFRRPEINKAKDLKSIINEKILTK